MIRRKRISCGFFLPYSQLCADLGPAKCQLDASFVPTKRQLCASFVPALS
jgi:hypothetical protein